MTLYQKSYDDNRTTYRLIFPSGLSEERIGAWLSSLGGTLHIDHSRILGVPSIVFETVATDALISHYLRLPKRDAGYIIGHLESLVPGIHAEVVPSPPAYEFTLGIDLHMTAASRQLALPKPADVSATILTSMQGLRENEVIVTQWIVTPAPHQPLPNPKAPPKSDHWNAWRSMTARDQASAEEIDDRRAKLSEPNMQATARVAVVAPHPIRAQEIAKGVVQAYRSVGSAANAFRAKLIKPHKLMHATHAATPFFFTSQLTLSELVPLVAWPLGSPNIAGLPSSRTRHMHVTNAVPRTGSPIGVSTLPGSDRAIAIDPRFRLQHIHTIGPIGSGKTWESLAIAEQDMKDGFGVVVIDPKGDLFQRVLERVPRDRIKDVIVWDLGDTDHPIGFNILQQGNSRAAIDELNNLVTNLFPDTLSVPQMMYFGLHALAEHGTFVDLPSFIRPEGDEVAWRNKIIRQLTDPQVKKFWENYTQQGKSEQASTIDRDLATLQRRIWPFVSRPEIRNTLGQEQSSFTMDDVVSSSKILVVRLNRERIGRQAAGMMASLIMSSLWSAVRTTPHERPVMLFMDEFQDFLTMPTDPSEMLAQSRSFGLGMVLSHQHLGQLTNPELRAAVLANARSKIVFQTSAEDARRMAGEMGSGVTADDLQNLQTREAIARVVTESGVSSAFTLRTRDASPPTGVYQEVLAHSRATYGRPLAEVEAEMEARRRVTTVDPNDRRPMGRRKIDDS